MKIIFLLITSIVLLLASSNTLEKATKQYKDNNYTKALPILLRLSKNSADAQYMLGRMYDMGQGVEQDIKKAIKLYELASEKNNKYAQYALATIYLNGYGGYLNRDKGEKYLLLSSSNGYKRAAKLMKIWDIKDKE